jgi:hypothetical protein
VLELKKEQQDGDAFHPIPVYTLPQYMRLLQAILSHREMDKKKTGERGKVGV